jgi:diadenylate cyclase
MNLDFVSLLHLYWKPCVETALFWFAYYQLLIFLRSTGALQVLKGLFLVFIFFIIVQFLGLETIATLMNQILPISVIAFLVVFQNELRRGLTRMGQSSMFKIFLKEEKLVDEIAKAVSGLSKKRIGALIALEREMGLKPFAESGVAVDAVVSFELLSTIFMPQTPLHDGGVIIRGSRIESAGCIFPLSQSRQISKLLGTRHRAAVGLAEESDAVVLVVSEQTGTISIAEKGELLQDVTLETLRSRLMNLYRPERPARRRFSFFNGTPKSEKRHETAV